MNNTSPDQAEDYQELSDRLRGNFLDRLHWSIFGPLEDIRVKDENDVFTPFLGHDIASESLANPPLTRIEVNIDSCMQKAAHDEHDEDDGRYKGPEPLIIDNMDGSSISLYDFVSEVHKYLNENKEELYKCEDELYISPTTLADGQQMVDIIPNDGEFTDYNSEDESTEQNYFLESGNIPEGNRFYFDRAELIEADIGVYHIYVSVFVEGDLGLSLETFLARKG